MQQQSLLFKKTRGDFELFFIMNIFTLTSINFDQTIRLD